MKNQTLIYTTPNDRFILSQLKEITGLSISDIVRTLTKEYYKKMVGDIT